MTAWMSCLQSSTVMTRTSRLWGCFSDDRASDLDKDTARGGTWSTKGG